MTESLHLAGTESDGIARYGFPDMTDRGLVPNTDIPYRLHGDGDRAVILVHGFLDDQSVWDEVVARLKTRGITAVGVDLAGSGDRSGAEGPFDFHRFAHDVGAVVDAVGKPFVIVGQSMGAPVAELVAAERPGSALGLLLVTPVPLAGAGLPADAIEPFRSLGDGPDRQRALRRQASPGLSEAALDRLVTMGARIRPEVVRELADSWNMGVAEGLEQSHYQGPVVIVRATADPFDELVTNAIAPRFLSPRMMVVDGAGHWAHVEQPTAIAAAIDALLNATGPVGRTV
jgi:pimeloyl-ACP methyl ester carboxylesterase